MALDGRLITSTAAVLFITATITMIFTGGALSEISPIENVSNAISKAQIVLRIDDIQDYAYKPSQSWLLDYHSSREIPVDLAVIMGYIGEDSETVSLIKDCLRSGEMSVHGWLHENLATVNQEEQALLLRKALDKSSRIFGFKPNILTPPMFSYNKATLQAMAETGYTILSSSADQLGPEIPEIKNIPATVELSFYRNQTWSMKPITLILEEVRGSVERCGYAVIVLHPQEFMQGDRLDATLTYRYDELVTTLLTTYELTDLEGLVNK